MTGHDVDSTGDSDSDVSSVSTLSRSTVKTAIHTPAVRKRLVDNTFKENTTDMTSARQVKTTAAFEPQLKSRCRKCAASFCVILFCCVMIAGCSYALFGQPSFKALRDHFDCRLAKVDKIAMERNLLDKVYGQHIAITKVMASMDKFFSDKNNESAVLLSFHGWTGVGKNFVARLIVENLPNPQVLKLIIPLHFPHDSEGELYASQIQSWIRSNISRCAINVIVVDEMDKASRAVADGLKQALISMKTLADEIKSTSGVNKQQDDVISKTIVLLLSNSGGSQINRITLEHLMNGLSRDTLSSRHLEASLTSTNSWTWHQSLYAEQIIDEFVPFLPLEKRHVVRCVQSYLQSRHLQISDAKLARILDEFEYFPSSKPMFSKAGCKRVADFTALVVE